MNRTELLPLLSLITLGVVFAVVVYFWRSARRAQAAHGERPGEAFAANAPVHSEIQAAVHAEEAARAKGKPMMSDTRV